uniref:Leucine-rich repeat-containing N-terminal plant-type domain-containing protein n=1 Tax=Chenopodium quinoa TaxID=63459 RepID=A0A803N6E5_CHEQI
MGFRWFTTFMLVFCFSILVFNFFVLANSNLPSLQQSKPLCHDQEKIALLKFKQSFLLDCSASPSTTVESWQNESDYNVSNNATESRDCCRWDGVKCDKETGHVIGLDLSSSCLYGTFPHNSTLFSLNHLRVLNLSYNNFKYSQIPSDIGRLYKLTHLDLSFSAFSGQIPSEISTLSNLSVLDLSGSGDPSGVNQNFNLKLSDLSLEKLVYELSYLTVLSLSQVDLSSTVPLLLSNRTSLKAISLNDCNLFGDFPPSIFQLPNLQFVSVYMNLDLRGYLPEFHSSSRLNYLSVAETKFSGELPASLGNLGSLTTILDLEECKFSGQIPSSIGNLTNFTNMNLESNNFSGPLPNSIMNQTRLYSLGLSNMMNIDSEVLKSWLPKINSLGSLGLGLVKI